MEKNKERFNHTNSYDKHSGTRSEELFGNLEAPQQTIDQNEINKAKDTGYNAVHIAKTGRKSVSHGLNRVPMFGALKVGIEGLIGRTAGGEKLSPVQRKLYTLAGLLSGITYGSIGVSAYTGNPRIATISPFSSLIASAATAGAQAHIAGETSVGKIFKAKLIEQIKKYKGYAQKSNQENIENHIATITDSEANLMVQELTNQNDQTTLEDIAQNIDNYTQRKKIDTWSLNEQLPENDSDGEPYIYRGMYDISIATLKNIAQYEGLKINKLEEGEDICFTSGKAFNHIAIRYATLGTRDLSIVIQLSRKKLKENKIRSSGAGDKVTIDQDIPASVLQTGTIFVINYAKQRLEKINITNNRNTEHDQIKDILIKRIDKKENKISDIHYEKGNFSGKFLDEYDFLDSGSESTVYKSKDGSHVIKISEPYNSREEPLYNNRIQETMLGNTIFGNSDLEVIGYYENNRVKNPVYKQTYIQGEKLTEAQAKEYLKSQGAYELDGEMYYKYNNEIYKINDFSDNYIKDSSNNIYGIDVTMFKPRP